MEKRKIDLAKYADMHNEVELVGADETKISVRTHIPYIEKEAAARDMVEQIAMIHDDSCVYVGSNSDKYELYVIAKYYTDIDTEGIEPEDIANFIINDGFADQLNSTIEADYKYVRELYWYLYDGFKASYDDDRSLTKAIRRSFSFLFNGEDITETMAQAEIAKDRVFNAFNALRKEEEIKENTIDDGRLMIGGNVINFAKKE